MTSDWTRELWSSLLPVEGAQPPRAARAATDPSDVLDQFVDCLRHLGWMWPHVLVLHSDGALHAEASVTMSPRWRWDIRRPVARFALTHQGWLMQADPPRTGGPAEWSGYLAASAMRNRILPHRAFFLDVGRIRTPMFSDGPEHVPFVLDPAELTRAMIALGEAPEGSSVEVVARRPAPSEPAPRGEATLSGLPVRWSLRGPAADDRWHLNLERVHLWQQVPRPSFGEAVDRDRRGPPPKAPPVRPFAVGQAPWLVRASDGAAPTEAWLDDVIRTLADPDDPTGSAVWNGPYSDDERGADHFVRDLVASLNTLSWLQARIHPPRGKARASEMWCSQFPGDFGWMVAFTPKHRRDVRRIGWLPDPAAPFRSLTYQPGPPTPTRCAQSFAVRWVLPLSHGLREEFVARDQADVDVSIGGRVVGTVAPRDRRSLFAQAPTKSIHIPFVPSGRLHLDLPAEAWIAGLPLRAVSCTFADGRGVLEVRLGRRAGGPFAEAVP